MVAKVAQGMKSEKLTKMESTQMMMGPAVTTTTFIKGSLEPAKDFLKGRLLLILQANPWLCGTLSKRGKDVYLDYPPVVEAGDPVVERCFLTVGGAQISSSMDYVSSCKGVAKTPSEVPPGSKVLKIGCSPLVLTVAPDSQNDNSFIVILSISHVIVDGFNYFQILGMLSDAKQEIITLSPTRKQTIEDEAKKALGPAEYAWMTGGGVISNVICGMLCGGAPNIEVFQIDMDRVKKEKEDAAGKANGGFVSTNDIIVSSFGNANSSNWVFMPINFRNKLPLFKDSDAGNYEGSLVFGNGEFDSPADIRNCLKSAPPQFRRGANSSGQVTGSVVPLPGFCASRKARLAMVVSWVFDSFGEFKIPGCEQMMHHPHTDCSLVPFDMCVSFKPKAGKVAVACFSRNTDAAGLAAECPVGAKVSSAESYHSSS